MNTNFREILDIIDKVVEEKGWQTDKPNHVLTSTMIELAELAEHFQWKDSFEHVIEMSDEEKVEIGYEIVDVFFYLMRIAIESDIDMDKAFAEKIEIIRER